MIVFGIQLKENNELLFVEGLVNPNKRARYAGARSVYVHSVEYGEGRRTAISNFVFFYEVGMEWARTNHPQDWAMVTPALTAKKLRGELLRLSAQECAVLMENTYYCG